MENESQTGLSDAAKRRIMAWAFLLAPLLSAGLVAAARVQGALDWLGPVRGKLFVLFGNAPFIVLNLAWGAFFKGHPIGIVHVLAFVLAYYYLLLLPLGAAAFLRRTPLELRDTLRTQGIVLGLHVLLTVASLAIGRA